MGIFDMFPYSNLHELNLEWLVSTVKKLENNYNSIQQDIQNALDFINNFENGLDDTIDSHIAGALSYYYQRLNALEKSLTDLENTLNTDVKNQFTDLNEQIAELDKKILDIRSDLLKRMFDLQELLHEYKHGINTIIDIKTEELKKFIIDNVTSLDRLNVINPITGIYEDIQKVLNEMVEIIGRSNGITAEQYDSLQLTAYAYDNYYISAYDYDTKGYFELYTRLTYDLVWSPFSGHLEPFTTVINQLAELHQCALTANEYDALNLTVEEYDSMEITAFNYDWYGKHLVKLTTAENYDNLKLTAENYDNKNITAAEYEKGVGALLSGISPSCKCGYNIN